MIDSENVVCSLGNTDIPALTWFWASKHGHLYESGLVIHLLKDVDHGVIEGINSAALPLDQVATRMVSKPLLINCLLFPLLIFLILVCAFHVCNITERVSPPPHFLFYLICFFLEQSPDSFIVILQVGRRN